MRGLKGKYAVVTGAGKGIGYSIAQRYLEEGLSGVAVLDWDASLSTHAAEQLDPSGTRCIGLPCDVSDFQQSRNAIDSILAHFGRIDILVNNAGITRDAMFHKMEYSQWSEVIQVNLTGVFHLSRLVYPIMRTQKYGRIINIASTSAWGNIGQANYAASKAGILGFTKTLAMECGKLGITVNAIAPGCIETDMFRAVPNPVMDKLIAKIPMGHLGNAEDIAGTAAFLASDDAAFITGQCISVSGGMIML